MTLVRRSSPFGELVTLRQAMDRLFDDTTARSLSPFGFTTTGSLGLPLDVTNGADALVVEAALPGFKPDDVEITVGDRRLEIRAESHTDESTGEGESLVREIRRGRVSRILALPVGLEADKASATFENGLLTLRIPRAEAVKPRQIRINPTTDVPASTEPSAAATGDASGDTGSAT